MILPIHFFSSNFNKNWTNLDEIFFLFRAAFSYLNELYLKHFKLRFFAYKLYLFISGMKDNFEHESKQKICGLCSRKASKYFICFSELYLGSSMYFMHYLIYKKQGLDHIGICLKFRVRCILKVKYFDQGHLNSISLLVSRALKCLFSACQIC